MLDRQQLVLVRHGESTANAGGIWQGHLDFPLSERGREQARSTGEALSGENISGVYASPLARARETAVLISRGAGFAGEVVSVQGLIERHGGILQGTTHEERLARDPDLVEKLRVLPEPEKWPLVGAETDEKVLARFAEALASIRARHGAGEKLLIVTHGGVMRAFLRDLFGPEVFAGDQRAPNASITRLAWSLDGGPPELIEVASAHHLPPAPG